MQIKLPQLEFKKIKSLIKVQGSFEPVNQRYIRDNVVPDSSIVCWIINLLTYFEPQARVSDGKQEEESLNINKQTGCYLTNVLLVSLNINKQTGCYLTNVLLVFLKISKQTGCYLTNVLLVSLNLTVENLNVHFTCDHQVWTMYITNSANEYITGNIYRNISSREMQN